MAPLIEYQERCCYNGVDCEHRDYDAADHPSEDLDSC